MYSYTIRQCHVLHASIIYTSTYINRFISRVRLLFGEGVITAVPISHGHSPLHIDYGLDSRTGHGHLPISSAQSCDRGVSMI
jgi:hypothetical protein